MRERRLQSSWRAETASDGSAAAEGLDGGAETFQGLCLRPLEPSRASGASRAAGRRPGARSRPSAQIPGAGRGLINNTRIQAYFLKNPSDFGQPWRPNGSDSEGKMYDRNVVRVESSAFVQ